MIKTAKPLVEERLVRVAAGPIIMLHGMLRLPEGVRAIVLFAYGSDSGQRSPRNVHVAQVLNEARLGTLLIDLLAPMKRRPISIPRICGSTLGFWPIGSSA
jgi:putative phosphoribosyl transferase